MNDTTWGSAIWPSGKSAKMRLFASTVGLKLEDCRHRQTSVKEYKMAQIRILMPTYNRPQLLIKAIESIQNQTFSDWRLLVLNDGGESVCDLIKDLGDARIDYLELAHGGKSKALNRGIADTNEPYIGYLDDDDIYYPQHLEVLFDAIRGKHNRLAYADTYLSEAWIEPGGQRRIIRRSIEHRGRIKAHHLWFRNYINHKCILHDRALIERIGPYDETLPVFIDWDMLRRMSQLTPFQYVPRITSEHYIYQNLPQITTQAPLSAKEYQEHYWRVVRKGLPIWFGFDHQGLAKTSEFESALSCS